MSLYALNIVNDLTLHAPLSDSHIKEIFQECFKLRVFCQRAVSFISVIIGYLATLRDQYTIKTCLFLNVFVRADLARIFENLALCRN